MLYSLALIPVIGLLIFIYRRDKNEKEPMGFLISLFFLGMATIVSAIILELIGDAILGSIFPYPTVGKAVIDAMLIVAPAEELGKYLVLRLRTWKNKNFNYSYDAIVYAVFVSLGFAAFENVEYVFSYGVLTALTRMFTAVPGHACFAVLMGFFYSKAKYASLTDKKGKSVLYKALAMLVPILTHGIYDAILMAAEVNGSVLLSTGVWITYVAALFVASIIIIIISSKNDFCIVTIPESEVVPGMPGAPAPGVPYVPVQTIYRPSIAGNWTCNCGAVNTLNFCGKCGSQRPIAAIWTCPQCGSLSTLNFCGRCGNPKPQNQYSAPIQQYQQY